MRAGARQGCVQALEPAVRDGRVGRKLLETVTSSGRTPTQTMQLRPGALPRFFFAFQPVR